MIILSESNDKDNIIDFEAAKKEADEEKRKKITELILKNTKSF